MWSMIRMRGRGKGVCECQGIRDVRGYETRVGKGFFVEPKPIHQGSIFRALRVVRYCIPVVKEAKRVHD
jgi:hypothetical protein